VFVVYPYHRDPHSFPTRRSSDLMLTLPSGVPLDPLRSQAACPYGPTSPGDCPKCAATRDRSTMLMTMSGGGSGPDSEVPPTHAVQYQLVLPAWWNLYQPAPLPLMVKVVPPTLVK